MTSNLDQDTINAYAKNIYNGKWTAAQVPDAYKDAVSKALITSGEGVVDKEDLGKAESLLATVKKIQGKDWGKVVGPQISSLPSYMISGDMNDTNNLIKQAQGIQILDNMGLMKGVLSDSDIAIIKSASTALNPNTDPKSFDRELNSIKMAAASIVNAPKLTAGQQMDNGDGTYSYKNMDGTVHTGYKGDGYVDKTYTVVVDQSWLTSMGLYPSGVGNNNSSSANGVPL